MQWIGKYVVVFAAMALSACMGSESATRGLTSASGLQSGASYVARDYAVQQVRVSTAAGLTSSEANSYFPGSDVVWREDPMGDRMAQVSAVMQEAMDRGVAGSRGATPVTVDVVITRFHALTEKTRYSSLPGTHDIRFTLTVRNAQTGAIIEGPRSLRNKFKALTGDEGIAAQARGETQRVRIVAEMARFIRAELGLRS